MAGSGIRASQRHKLLQCDHSPTMIRNEIFVSFIKKIAHVSMQVQDFIHIFAFGMMQKRISYGIEYDKENRF